MWGWARWRDERNGASAIWIARSGLIWSSKPNNRLQPEFRPAKLLTLLVAHLAMWRYSKKPRAKSGDGRRLKS
jgi:hypothetical protein